MEPELIYCINGTIDTLSIESLFKKVGWSFNQKHKDYYLSNSYCYITCEYDHEIIGFINCVSNGYSDSYIQDLMVDPKFQRKGIAHTLVSKMLQYLKDKEITNVSLIMSEDLIDFYKSQGFKIQYSGRIKLN